MRPIISSVSRLPCRTVTACGAVDDDVNDDGGDDVKVFETLPDIGKLTTTTKLPAAATVWTGQQGAVGGRSASPV